MHAVQVLDARDPDGTRCTFLEQHLRKNHREKHLILLLNKIDLVPPRVTRAWLRRLSADFPVLAFRSGLTKAFGKGALISLLRQIARLRSDKKAISVGFIGYPNVGKSSVINTLRTKKVRGTHSTKHPRPPRRSTASVPVHRKPISCRVALQTRRDASGRGPRPTRATCATSPHMQLRLNHLPASAGPHTPCVATCRPRPNHTRPPRYRCAGHIEELKFF